MTNMNLGGASPTADRPDEGASAKDLARSAVQSVKAEAANFADGAKEKALDQVEQGKQAASKTMGDFANAVRKAGDDLAEHDQSMAGQMVKKAADGLESLSRSVSDKRPEEMLDAVRGFARENPAAFIAGSVLIGLAIGRFAKSSERRDDMDTSTGRLQSAQFAGDRDERPFSTPSAFERSDEGGGSTPGSATFSDLGGDRGLS